MFKKRIRKKPGKIQTHKLLSKNTRPYCKLKINSKSRGIVVIVAQVPRF